MKTQYQAELPASFDLPRNQPRLRIAPAALTNGCRWHRYRGGPRKEFMHQPTPPRPGFTLIELLIVTAVALIVVATLLPRSFGLS